MPPLSVAVPLLGSLSAVFIMSQFYRSTIAVIAPDLVREMPMSAETLGLVSGAFFVAMACMQLPVGVLLDRFGSRRVIPALLTIAVAGAVIFALGTAPGWLILGQFLVGIGCSGVFMGGLSVISRWFPVDRFSTIVGVTIAISIFGILLSATPLAAAAEAVGWRGAFLASAGITAALALVVLLVVRDAPRGHPFHADRRETLAATLAGAGQVLRDRRVHRLAALALTGYGATMTVRGLWGGPFLTDVYGLDAIARGNVLLLVSVGFLVGTLSYGPLERLFNSRKRVVLAGGACSVTLLALLSLLPAPPLTLVVTLLIAHGVVAVFYILLLAHTRSLFPDRLVGRAFTAINFANFVGVALLQTASGVLVGLFPEVAGAPPAEAYRAVFGFLAIVQAAGLTIYAGVRDAPPRGDAGGAGVPDASAGP